jgi:hypothetical protein
LILSLVEHAAVCHRRPARATRRGIYEAFNASLKRETFQRRRRWNGPRQARLAVFRWVTRYNILNALCRCRWRAVTNNPNRRDRGSNRASPAITARSALRRPRARDLPTHNRQLMPQDQDLHLFGSVRPRQQGEPAEKTDEDEI